MYFSFILCTNDVIIAVVKLFLINKANISKVYLSHVTTIIKNLNAYRTGMKYSPIGPSLKLR